MPPTITAPNNQPAQDPSIFLAGGITGCPDWQTDLIGRLNDQHTLTLLNPRRPDFDVSDPNASRQQITWEYTRLRQATAISFWFPAETLCPIVLFELGAWTRLPDPVLFVATHPQYARRADVVEQVRLARPDVTVGDSLDWIADGIRGWMANHAGG